MEALRTAPCEQKLVAKWEFAGAEEDELHVNVGEIVEGVQVQGEWWIARKGGAGENATIGLVPAAYLGPAPTPALKSGDVKVLKDGAVSTVSPLVGFAAGTKTGDGGSASMSEKGAEDASGARVAAPRAPGMLKRVKSTMRTPPPKDTRKWAHLGHYSAYYGSMAATMLGAPAIAWSLAEDPRASNYAPLWVTIATLLLGIATFALEFFTWEYLPAFRGKEGWRTLKGFPYRGVLYVLIAIPMFCSLSTCIAGVPFIVAGATYIGAVVQGERCEGRATSFDSTQKKDKWEDTRDKTVLEACGIWVVKQFEAGEVSKWLVLVLFVAGNLTLGIYKLVFWMGVVDDRHREYNACMDYWEKRYDPNFADSNDAKEFASRHCGAIPLSYYAPLAKVFGGLLNLNCSLLVLPVARTLVRAMNNATFGNTWTLARVLPLRKNVTFHKMLGKVVGVFATLHVFFHWVNFAISPSTTLATFPGRGDNAPWYGSIRLAPWYTGTVITVAMLLLYPAAAKAVKSRLWDTFWMAHHLYIVFYAALLFHGPEFWAWSMLPLALFIGERIYRNRMSTLPIYLKSLRWVDPVLELQFAPKVKGTFKFKEGQFVWLCVPTVGATEWHPFTISSAMGDLTHRDFVSIHMRIHRGGWTERVKDFFELMNPSEEYPFFLYRRENGQMLPGKMTGPDGLPLLRVDGPHAAPAQHYSEYPSTIVVGAGIGMTPSVSIIRSVLLYKWRMGFLPQHLTFVWLVRQSEVDAFQWFIAALSELMAERARDVAAGNVNKENFLEMHIFVTSCKDDAPAPTLLESAEVDPMLAPYTNVPVSELMRTVFQPPVESKDFETVMARADAAMGDIEGLKVGVLEGTAPHRRESVVAKAARKEEEGEEEGKDGKEEETLLATRSTDGGKGGGDGGDGRGGGGGGGKEEDDGAGIEAAALAAAESTGKGAVVPRQDLRPEEPNRLQDIYVWKGRPVWKPLFERVTRRSVQQDMKDLACVFCGSDVIGQALKEQCRHFSSLREGVQFSLHKENF